jgi:hypothetical protein
MSKVHLIYYDENIDFNSENYGYVKQFKNRIKGAFFPVKNVDSLKKLVEKIKSISVKGSFTLVTSGRAAEKVIPICSSIINNVIIFCFYVDKYIPLKNKYSKIKTVLNNFSSIFDYLSDSSIKDDSTIIGNKFITFEDYKSDYINFHKKLAEYFNENYNDLGYDSSYKNKFIDFINSSNVEDKSDIIRWVNKVSSGTVKQFIEAYTGETHLCYSLNRWLRNLNESEYNGIKYFAGPFSYALYKFAYNNRDQGIYYSKKFYRKMTIKLSDFYLYKMSVGELICYPAFTSTSEKDISKYNFPTNIAIEVNGLTENDISVVLIIDYKCKNKKDSTPCVSASEYSVSAGEQEFIFPPFSFFKITGIEERDGKPNNPHIIYMTTPSKSHLLEFWLKKNKKISYDSKEDRLYDS